jgi:hypothetical protein
LIEGDASYIDLMRQLATEPIDRTPDHFNSNWGKLQHLMDKPKSLYQLYAKSAAYAGYVKGLCHTYIDAYACEREESELPYQRLLHLDLNSETLSETLKILRSTCDGSVDSSFIDPKLGFRGEVDDTGEQYLTAVSGRIRDLVKSLQRAYMPHVTELLLSGPHAANKRFHEAIRAAFQDLDADERVLASLGHKSGNRFSGLLLLGERQRLRSVDRRGKFNVSRAMNANGGGRAYTACKTRHCWFKSLTVD